MQGSPGTKMKADSSSLSDVIQVLRDPGSITVPLAILRTYTTDVNWSVQSNDPLFEQLANWVLVAV